MIRTPTVLILGAGASWPYGFPTGKELKNAVCQSVLPREQPHPLAVIFEEAGVKVPARNDFRAQLFESGQASVDAFLEHRREFQDIGKLAMSMALIRHEIHDALFSPPRGNRDTRWSDWYGYLFGKLADGVAFEDFDQNKLSIITFNYDRSLEHFLFTAMKNSYGRAEKEISEQLQKMQIIHVHGTLGPLPWQSEPGRPYAPDVSFGNVRMAADSILIAPEADDSSRAFVQARQALAVAQRVYFLGFGYHPANLTRLGYSKQGGRTGGYGSCFGLGAAECTDIQNQWGIITGGPVYGVLEYLKHCTHWV